MPDGVNAVISSGSLRDLTLRHYLRFAFYYRDHIFHRRGRRRRRRRIVEMRLFQLSPSAITTTITLTPSATDVSGAPFHRLGPGATGPKRDF